MRDLNKSITEENGKMQRDMTDKIHTLNRCAEAVRNARNKMRIVGERHKEETRIRDEKIKNIKKRGET